jgi:PST family polysaccharide transporter
MDVEALRARFLRVFRKVSFLSALCVAGMHVCAAEIILIMYGDAWVPAIPLLSILAFAIYSRGVNGAFTALLNATGRADLLMRSTAINTVVTVGMILLGAALGSVETLSICIAIAANLEMILPIWFCGRFCLDMAPLRFFAHFVPDLGAALLTCFLAVLIPWNLPNIFVSAIVKAAFVCAVMFAVKVLVNRFVYHEQIHNIKDII